MFCLIFYSADTDAEGKVGNITIASEAGQPCTLLSPFLPAGFVVHRRDNGAVVPTTAARRSPDVPGLWRWPTEPGLRYGIEHT